MKHRRAITMAILMGLALCAALLGCGNKGPLVHPANAPASSASTPAADDSTDD